MTLENSVSPVETNQVKKDDVGVTIETNEVKMLRSIGLVSSAGIMIGTMIGFVADM